MKATPDQLTIRKLPRRLGGALRKKAAEDGLSLNSAAIEAMERGLGLADEPIRHHDLDFLAGTWVEDPKFDAAVEAQRKIEPAMWK
ncbi:MAG: hypothetical protein ACR2NX_16685 [Chthoniobacterales bacterium]